mmetsp:Transcript_34640/g.95444  ORF Transcript_34640/g.95444 Transcript_34640/m.95444 type:complete len:224 (+) Transcript_34640:267-938(+)
MQARVAAGVNGEGVGPVAQQELHARNAVCADGVTQRRDARGILGVEGLLLSQIIVESFKVANLGGLMDVERRPLNRFHLRLQLLGHAPHPLVDLQHELFVVVIFQHRLHAILLDVLENRSELGVQLQSLQAFLKSAILCGRFAGPQLAAVMLRDGLRLEPTPHRIRVLRELLQAFGHLWVARKVILHLLPRAVVDPRDPRKLQLCTIAELGNVDRSRIRHHVK